MEKLKTTEDARTAIQGLLRDQSYAAADPGEHINEVAARVLAAIIDESRQAIELLKSAPENKT